MNKNKTIGNHWNLYIKLKDNEYKNIISEEDLNENAKYSLEGNQFIINMIETKKLMLHCKINYIERSTVDNGTKYKYYVLLECDICSVYFLFINKSDYDNCNSLIQYN